MLQATFFFFLDPLILCLFTYFCSANLEKVTVHPNMYVLMIQLLARGERYAELNLFVINKVSKFVFCIVCLDSNVSSLYAAYVV